MACHKPVPIIYLQLLYNHNDHRIYNDTIWVNIINNNNSRSSNNVH